MRNVKGQVKPSNFQPENRSEVSVPLTKYKTKTVEMIDFFNTYKDD